MNSIKVRFFLKLAPTTKTMVSETSTRLTARTGVSWRSFGEVISCDIESHGSSLQSITVASRPWFPMTLADYGANLSNVRAVVVFFVQRGAVKSSPAELS